ncbi:radical SAM protein [Baekduia sp. Peel2402]|uniref:radical SAM protein n=1 Tax=Baekduia sp. Peel2402 TaxID=3458296 RepID=UPI00403E56F1
MKSLKLSRYLIAGATVGESPNRSRVLMATRSGQCFLIPEQTWQALRAGRFEDIPAALVGVLENAEILVAKEADELAVVVAENREAIETSPVLVQIIQPSAACQLGCGYCGQEHRNSSMDAAVQVGLVTKIRSRLTDAARRGQHYEELRIGWFGAEPLLAVPVMRTLTTQLVEVATTFGCDYTARVVTNGLGLSLPLARELQDVLKVGHIEVTLDGPARSHDLRRVTKKGGRGTFAPILRRLRSIAAEPDLTLDVSLRCNVDKTNADAVPELIDLLADEGLHERFSLYFAPIHAWGNDAADVSLDANSFASREIEWFAQMLSLGYEVPLLPSRREIVCLAVRPDSRVTDADGIEYNCSEAPYVPAYGNPNRYETGRVDRVGDSSDLDFANFNEEVLERDELPCHSCPVLPVCGGACPKSWADGAAPCPSFKLNAGERMMLYVAESVRD